MKYLRLWQAGLLVALFRFTSEELAPGSNEA